ncbi:unnamed protein product [Tuber melanosporum]|uniref:(Perigord truffle) hypothetical protein n=1 Tax=Tuber melanosporum (strain Mel28) TaxID=656061 RepID=D5GDI9_TUBMM|nr:uncharacterized protein GSTUM_00001046001 [Tuber melanosporum]CAZ82582.1 unnamed protein product [Tuber melanosporum]
MADSHDPFPNVKEKLTARTKKSAFEKSRLEAEAKRLREEAETAAVYKDFVASFEQEPSCSTPGASNLSGTRGSLGNSRDPTGDSRGGFRGIPPSGPGRRHFTSAPARGSQAAILLSGPQNRKRNIDSLFEREEEVGVFGSACLSEREKRRLRESNIGLLAFENSAPPSRSKDQYSHDDDSDSDPATNTHPKPTLQMTSLPPSTTKLTLTALFSATALKLDSIRIIPAPPPPGPSQPSPSVRKAASAIVMLSPETPSSDIDAAVSMLNGRYLGCGFWLGIGRHLPSTAVGTVGSGPIPAALQTYPFGARPPLAASRSLSRAPPVHRGGFASAFGSSHRGVSTGTSAGGAGNLLVQVEAPSDLKVLRLIHKTIESVLTHGPEFEALLMSSNIVKNDVKFSWLWDARSPEGVYYRWKLWEIISGTPREQIGGVDMFEPSSSLTTIWSPPRRMLKYEWAGTLRDVIEDEGFSSEELEDDRDDSDREEEIERPIGLMGIGEERRGRGYLGVLERAKLIHLISRIPTQTSKVRRGDVGRVMAFAMEHAEGGMGEEVVTVLVGNVVKPLAFSKAAKRENTPDGDDYNEVGSENNEGNLDTSAAKVIGLWLISDILSNSSLGIRNAWRYRQLFDVALREKGVFSHLGGVWKGSGWGRMKAEKFRRGVVEGVLEWWEKWCIFPQYTQEEFLRAFTEPVDREKTICAPGSQPPTEGTSATAPVVLTTKSKWKAVEAKAEAFNVESAVLATAEDVDGEPMADDDVDGESMVEDVDGEPMIDEEAEMEPETSDNHDGLILGRNVEAMSNSCGKPATGVIMQGFKIGSTSSTVKGGMGPRKRMRAEDMFADEDDRS